MALTSAQRQQRWRTRLKTTAPAAAAHLAEAQAAADLADKLDAENAKLFRDHEKLKRDIAEVRRVRDELRAEVYRLRKEAARTARDPLEFLNPAIRPKELVRWLRAAVHPDRVRDPEAKAYLHDVFTELSNRVG